MLVTKSYKFNPFQFQSKGIEITVSHDELGLGSPHDISSLRETFGIMARETEALLLIEQVKLGIIHPNQIAEKLRPWLPPISSLSTQSPTSS